MSLTGEFAALLTSVLFAFTSTFFTLAGRQVGSLVVNRTRLLLAVLFLGLAHFFAFGTLLPQAGLERWGWLALSGVIGLVLGDAFLFQAFIWIGPRLSMLLMSMAPVLATLLAWVFLGETLSAGQIAGVFITLSGIAWVVLERRRPRKPGEAQPQRYWTGILFGVGAASGQALGLITAKRGLVDNFPALSGTLMRMLSAALVMWLVTLFMGQARQTLNTLTEHRPALPFILAGAMTGPFLGVTLSLVAIQHTQVGVASTLMALPPVILLPISRLVFKEAFGWQAIAGTLLAMAGVAVLFLV